MAWMDPLDGNGTLKYSHPQKTFEIKQMSNVMGQNLIFSKDDIRWYDRFNRYGYIDPYIYENVLKEFLFFTKPDLHIFSATGDLRTALKDIPFFIDAKNRYTNSLWQLQTTNCPNKSPFMNLLSNSVTSKMDLPSISSESQTTTANIMGTEISIRGHSLKSDNGYDFTLSFTDSAYLELYTMVKAYDEYVRRTKTGEISPYKKHIKNNILSDQFSVYKFLVNSDGETIMYYAKATGVYFTDVPRSDFSDPTDFGKFSLGFHAQFIEDSNPLILCEFNKVVYDYYTSMSNTVDVWNKNGIDNSWATLPYIIKISDVRSRRRAPEGAKNYYDYRLKWAN